MFLIAAMLVGVVFGSLEAWQPTINTLLLILLTLLGGKVIKVQRIKHGWQRRRMKRLEDAVQETRGVVLSIQDFLDGSGDEFKHLH
jgi:hypothetical protein